MTESARMDDTTGAQGRGAAISVIGKVWCFKALLDPSHDYPPSNYLADPTAL
jgi:hypothetical protein